ncbi:hypothetical protein COB21_00090 [Candidatus Aerophobetes bacterium]|uniref:RanBP2-type domain-containing protein n=1 Tax=Aerophobetes bacterium TaxID=2030807 RepID=A0A2A4X7Z7_UNCAE|nr:MAG: hypothetical protein COB21_00090 [Candidatus Aerophobetes bacterium]
MIRKMGASVALFLALLSIGHATEICRASKNFEKTYFCEEQLLWEEAKLWVDMGEIDVCPVAIYVDAEGVYFNAITEERFGAKEEKYWWCSRCFWRNHPKSEICAGCQRPRKR